jgi:hypothetical protein
MEREWHATNSLRIVVCPAICRPNTHIRKAAGFPDGRQIKEMSGCAAHAFTAPRLPTELGAAHWTNMPQPLAVCRGSDRELARAAGASAVRGVRLRGADDENETARRSFRCGVGGARRGADLGNCQSVAGLCRLDKRFRGPCHTGFQMAKLTGEHRRALQVLAREPVGCAEVALLAEGFSVGQLATLVMDGFAKRRPIVTNVGGQEKIVLWMQITDAGRAALAE